MSLLYLLHTGRDCQIPHVPGSFQKDLEIKFALFEVMLVTSIVLPNVQPGLMRTNCETNQLLLSARVSGGEDQRCQLVKHHCYGFGCSRLQF